MAEPRTNRLLNAFRERLIGDTDFQTYVSYVRVNGVNTSDLDPQGPRVYPRSSVDVRETVYPCVTLFVERRRPVVWAPRTFSPAFVRVAFYSSNDQGEAMRMYEIASLLLHDEKTLLSTSDLCVHGVFEVDARDPEWFAEGSVWCGWALYKVKASVLA